MRDIITNRFVSRRTLREGSVGLFVLLGLGTFVLIFLWLNRFTSARSSYKAIVEFANAGGMQKGSTVRYRGVKVGNISQIQPRPNAVDVVIEITSPDLVIPRNVTVEANQSGLISESIIDITPKTSLAAEAITAKPLDKNCNSSLIVCNGSRLKGQIGISVDELIRSTTDLATRFSDPVFYQRVNRVLESSTAAASGIAALTQDFQTLSKSFQRQLNTFSSTANSVQRATNQLTASSTKTLDQLGVTAGQFSTTASQANRLLNNLDNLVTTNRSSLVGALNNITETSNQLRVTVSSLSPAVNRLTQGELLKNFETLSANAAQASANLRDASKSLSDPKNIVLLQQTLDSARLTFENTQKITSDLDELTGDPTFRQNLRQLVNGLSGLVSSTQQMQEQVKVAATLDSMKAAVINQQKTIIATPAPTKQVISHEKPLPAYTINPSTVFVETAEKQPEPTNSAVTTISSQEKLLQKLRNYSNERKQAE
ncbi:MCE family protein [Nostoc sp. CENA67]|uniref:MCE family protein n=1 Tax=Amazonocrinis nigriterrae CENA67 TaxID=2794033 RepID=A0A8J7HTW4_9NOST|nr:MlaD family protein [Amazonocrinis nigriterrae]MBH8565632.1 MCE family protein [Amazonocrinis nigriterrae CENA67]